MIKIYFGNTLIDDDNYLAITNEHKLFTNSFKLGSTASNSYKFEILKDVVSTQPTSITLKDNTTDLAILNVDTITENEYSYSYDCTDALTKMNYNYDASLIFVSGQTTLLAIAQDICSHVGITLGTNNFRGYDKTISWYDNTKTARDYIGYIAELNGGYAYIQNGVLYFKKQNTNSVKTINIDDCSDFEITGSYTITRVVFENGISKWEYGTNNGATLYLNSNNVYITEQEEVQDIFNEINNFTFYTFKTNNCPIDYNVKAGDIITFTDGTNNYPTIANYELTYNGGWLGGYKLEINSEQVVETKNNTLDEKVRNIDVKIDREANAIRQEVREDFEEVRQTQTATNLKIDIITSKDENNDIIGVKTTTGFTFDKNGLNISSSESTYNTLIDTTGTYYKDGDTILTQTTNEGTITKDMVLYGSYYYGVDENARLDKTSAMFVSQKFNDGTEDCIGHFYNGD